MTLQSLTFNKFYTQRNYEATTENNLKAERILPPAYIHNTHSKIWRVAALIFSIIIFPVGLYQLLHRLIGKIFIISSSPFLHKHLVNNSLLSANEYRTLITDDERFGYKRITAECDGYLIDVMLVIPKNCTSNRWLLVSEGSGEFYEHTLTQNKEFRNIVSSLRTNALFFNYPGVGASSGFSSKDGMIKTYDGLLSFLEDGTNGLGAKQIIGYGHSFVGSGVQAEALLSHTLKQSIKYVFIQDRAAASISELGSAITCWPLGNLVSLCGWNFNCAEASKKLTKPEIILQTAHVQTLQEIKTKRQLMHDGVIPPNVSLAEAFLEPTPPSKTIFGLAGWHEAFIRDSHLLNEKIEELLQV